MGRRRRLLAWLAAAPLAARAQGPASGAAPAPDPDGTLRRVQLLADAAPGRVRTTVTVDIEHAWRDRRTLHFTLQADARQRLAAIGGQRIDMDDFAPWAEVAEAEGRRGARQALAPPGLAAEPSPFSAVQAADGRVAVRVERPLPAAALRLRLAFEQPLPEAPDARHEYAPPLDFGERGVQEIHLLLSLPPPVAARSVVLQGDLASAQVVAGGSREATRVVWFAEGFRARQAGTVRWRRR